MTSDTDHTLPGKAGLYFSCAALNDAGWQQEHEARARLERWCAYCGQTACYGYGVTLKDDGVWTCADASCRSSAEDEIARRLCPPPPGEPLIPPPSTKGGCPAQPVTETPDLFGAAA